MAARAARRLDYDYDYDYGYNEGDFAYSPAEGEKTSPKKPKLKAVKNIEKPVSVLNTKLRSRAQVVFLVFAVLAMAVTVRSGISASRGYALVAVQTQAQNLEQENERLRIEIAKLKSPQRIEEIAKKELHMGTPSKVYFAHEK